MVRRQYEHASGVTSAHMNRRVVVRGSGGPEVLHLIEEPVPEPAAGQLRIRSEALGVAYGDVMRRRGVLAPPGEYTPGYDVVGVVDALGSGVSGFAIGDRVATMMPGPGFGGYASAICARADRVSRVPDGLDPIVAVALGLNYLTAYQLIHRFIGLKSGDSLLIHGAAGGVGTAALQLGSLLGLTMFGTASKGKHGVLQDYGAHPIDYRNEDFVERMGDLAAEGVDGVIDGIGGKHLWRSHAVLKPTGTLVALGVSGDVDGGLFGVIRGFFNFIALRFRPWGPRTRMYNITYTAGATYEDCRRDWETLMGLALAGKITPVIGASMPLDEVRKAHEMMDNTAVAGKIVLTV